MSETRKRGRPATGVMPKRNVRVGDDWDRAVRIAEKRGETMSDVVRQAVKDYVRRHRSELD